MVNLHIPKFVVFIYKRFKEAGYQAYLVGGAVRDACLQRPITDWDVVTSALPEEIKAIFSDIKLFALKHDTVTLVDSGRHFEITSFRGRIKSLQEDLTFRDFTINAMAYDLEKSRVLDPCGGKEDIKGKLIRAVGNPQERFQEDPIRLLRAVRIATELGFKIETETLKTLTSMAPRLRSTAPERIREELMKLLASSRPSTGFSLMVRTGLLKYFLPELLEGYRKKQNAYHHHTIFKHIMETIDRVQPDPVLRLTALLHDIGKPRVREKIQGEWRFLGHEEASAALAHEIMDRLRFSKDTILKVNNLVRHHMIDYNSEWSDSAVRRLIRRVGPGDIMDLLVFRRADLLAHPAENQELDLLDELETRIKHEIKGHVATKTQDLAIDGHYVMEILGISPGKEVGEILEDLIEQVTDNPELNNKTQLSAILEKIKGS